MKLENQVTSVELSNKIHKLDVTTPSLYYRDWTGAKENEIEKWDEPDYCPDHVNCYTVAELGEMLPSGCYTRKLDKDSRNWEKWGCSYSNNDIKELLEISETEANARTKMLIYLLENKLI